MKRAEEVKDLVSSWKTKGVISDKIPILEDATGYSYDRVFGKYLTNDVKEVLVEEPYVREHYQVNAV
jgi:hypothetical protein